MHARVAAAKSRTDDGDNKGFFGLDVFRTEWGGLERDSTTTSATFSKHLAMEEASAAADEVRWQSAFLREQRGEQAERRQVAGRTRLHSARERRERLSQLAASRREAKLADAAELKERRARWEEERKAMRASRGGYLHGQVEAARVAEQQAASRALDARLDEEERLEGERHQVEAAREAAALRRRLAAVRGEKLAHGRRMVAAEARARAAVEEARQASLHHASRQGEAVRDAESEWRGRRLRADAMYLEQARENRERVLAVRQAARESKQESLGERKRAASEEVRVSEALNARARDRQRTAMHSNRRAVSAVFKQRFVSRTEEEAWSVSPLRKLHRSSARFGQHSSGHLSRAEPDEAVAGATSSRAGRTMRGTATRAQPSTNPSPRMRPRSARAAIRV